MLSQKKSTASPPKILVVDDKAANRDALCLLLAPLEVEILTAASGNEALSLFLDHAFVLILLDVQMPDMDGYEVAQMIRGIETEQPTPILFVTAAYRDDLHRMAGYRAGAVDYIEKPIDDEILLAKVTIFLELYQARCDREQTLSIALQNEAKFRAMVDHVGVGMLRCDIQALAILEANRAAAEMLGFADLEALRGLHLHTFFAPEEALIHPETIQQLQDGVVTSCQFERGLRRRDGSALWGRISVSLIPGIFPAQAFLVIAIEDGTQRKKDEALLRQKNEELERASRAKSEFLANMSHEIRTPMNAILGMADLLWESQLHGDQRKFVQIFRSAGENLLSIINDILDLSKIEAGCLQLEDVSFNLSEEMQVVCEIMSLRCNAKGLEIQRHLGAEVPEWIMGDPTRLRQIFLNLLSNAVKFTEQGVIRFTAEWLAHDPHSGHAGAILVRVADTGVGIPKERLQTIFEQFVQVDSTITRRFGGTGLGLAIVKRLTEAMGGRVGVSSEPGKGTEFHITLPYRLGEKPKLPTLLDLSGVRVLVVDDNADNRVIFREILEQMGASVVMAEDGAAALKMMEEAHAHGTPYQMILLDIIMPGLDGFQVLECWQSVGRPGIPVMVLTSEHHEAYLAKCRTMGIHHYMIKPVRRADLIQVIESLLFCQEAEKGDVLCLTTAAHVPKILLVDDSEDNRVLIQAYLKQYTCQLSMAENGLEALRALETGRFDLVLMDIQMPVMDGYAATRSWRAIEQERNLPRVPIVALTAYALREDIAHSLEAGCDTHMTKPVKKRSLLDIIEKYLAPV
ncbi:MAG: response regulator [Magnetococcales bacterium]|nr:response regulator [Magnetococcales bacterium]MBF0114264.1 response regulator [Magnetococcales bacterium]